MGHPPARRRTLVVAAPEAEPLPATVRHGEWMRERRCPDLRRRPGGSIIGFVTGSLIDAGPAIARPNLRRGSAKRLLRRPDVFCRGPARESARAISFQPAGHHPDGPDRSIQRRTYDD